MGACTRRIAPASAGTKAKKPCHRPSRSRCLVQTLPASTLIRNKSSSRRIAPHMDTRPVGVFDSGMGGLTVLHELLVTLPHEDFVYLGDGARLPYGPRPLPQIRRFAREIGGWLEAQGVKL